MPADKAYELALLPAAVKELQGLPTRVQGQVERTVDRLLERYRAGERPQDFEANQRQPGAYRVGTGEYCVLSYGRHGSPPVGRIPHPPS